jgi:AAA15 family ATPase/GTPase
MKLKWFRVREFQSVWDSGEIAVDDITCLVGKNEAGKTVLLKALYRLNPIVNTEGVFNVTIDYPRRAVEDYRDDIDNNKREPAIPIEACFSLEKEELSEIESIFGKGCIGVPEFTLSQNYENISCFDLDVDEEKALKYLVESAAFSEQTREVLKTVTNPSVNTYDKIFQEQEQTQEVLRVQEILSKIREHSIDNYIYNNILSSKLPKFLYFDEYYQLSGHDNINNLNNRETTNQLKPSDYPMLGLIRLARLRLNDLLNPTSTIELKGKLEGASNHLTRQVLKYWSQNKHLRMTFDVRPAMPGDPEGLRQGINIWGGVFDTRHEVTTELGSRSRGFVWFFSFLAWYSDIKRDSKPVILLLDEPGLTLHAKAQQDLLRYFETELKGNNQLIYTTHSPFMIDPTHFERVRIVQDKSIDTELNSEEENEGTKVLTDTFAATSDSLFPLQSALGYEIHQTLFVGPNSLIVEGVADLLYLQAMSAILQESGHRGLDERWTITPVGGSKKVPTFVALLGSQKGMNVATLIDFQTSDQQDIENLYKKKLLKKANVLTFADITKTNEADIEDMFSPEFYLDLVNAEFASQLAATIELKKLTLKHPRILMRIEEYLTANPLKSGHFGHYRPARYFTENIAALRSKISNDTIEHFKTAFDTLNALII